MLYGESLLKYTGWRQNDFNVHGYSSPRMMEGETVAAIGMPGTVALMHLVMFLYAPVGGHLLPKKR